MGKFSTIVSVIRKSFYNNADNSIVAGYVKASIIADSVNSTNNRLTTFILEYPRFIHSEFMTHRLLSRNAESSRAVPVNKLIENIMEEPAIPMYWGKNKSGMQADSENDSFIKTDNDNIMIPRHEAWLKSRDDSIKWAQRFNDAGYHKQIVNRILEPYKMMKVICSATEYDNFFWLRCHKDAQPEIRQLAEIMYECYKQSKPNIIRDGDYHLPFINDAIYEECEKYVKDNNTPYSMLDLTKMVSASCCAQVSYRRNDTSIEKALNIYDHLVKSQPIHASPFEHQARPITNKDKISFLTSDNNNTGITHMSRDNTLWSGNFRGWIQHRHEIPSNTCWKYSE